MRYSLHACALKSYPADAAIRRAAAIGYDGYEFDVDRRINRRSGWAVMREELQNALPSLKTIADEVNIRLHSICLGVLWCINLAAAAYEERVFAQEIIRDCISFCAITGSNTLLIPVGTPFECGNALARDNLVNALKPLSIEAEDANVVLAVENIAQRIIWRAEDLAEIIDRTNSAAVKAYYDIGNSALIGLSPANEIEYLSNRIWQMHIKDVQTVNGQQFPEQAGNYDEGVLTRGDSRIWDTGNICDLGSGSIHWQDVAEAIKGIGYDGYLVNEVVARPDDPDGAAVNNLKTMKLLGVS